jgi:hypothetical protein
MQSPTDDNLPIAQQMDDPEPGYSWFFSIAGIVVFVAIVLALSVLYFRARGSLIREVQIDAPIRALTDLRQSQKELLAEYARYRETLPDGSSVERIRVPIGRAMEIVAAQLKTGSGGTAENRRGDASSPAAPSNASSPERVVGLGKDEP